MNPGLSTRWASTLPTDVGHFQFPVETSHATRHSLWPEDCVITSVILYTARHTAWSQGNNPSPLTILASKWKDTNLVSASVVLGFKRMTLDMPGWCSTTVLYSRVNYHTVCVCVCRFSLATGHRKQGSPHSSSSQTPHVLRSLFVSHAQRAVM